MSVSHSALQPSLNALPLQRCGLTLPSTRRCGSLSGTPRRPPVHPSSHTSTWRNVAAMTVGRAHNVELIGVALLAAEARKRRLLVFREKCELVRQDKSPDQELKKRVQGIENELKSISRSIIRFRATKMKIRKGRIVKSNAKRCR